MCSTIHYVSTACSAALSVMGEGFGGFPENATGIFLKIVYWMGDLVYPNI